MNHDADTKTECLRLIVAGKSTRIAGELCGVEQTLAAKWARDAGVSRSAMAVLRAKVMHCLRTGMSRAQAAALHGISRSTVDTWMQQLRSGVITVE